MSISKNEENLAYVSESSTQNKADLSELRDQISFVDSSILKLFSERMQIARDIAKNKLNSQKPVYDSRREEELLTEVRARYSGSDCLRAENLMRSLMRMSRGVQYDLLRNYDENYEIGKILELASTHLPAIKRVVYQGAESSYSSRACRKMYPEAKFTSVTTFAQACSLVVEGAADVAVLPLENSTAGTVDDVYDLMIEHHLSIWQSLAMPIEHRLMAFPGVQLSDIKQVISHPQALAQCSEAIRRYGWSVKESLNTAYAAAYAAEGKNSYTAAIASDEAAVNYNLTILLPNLCNTTHNQTRFIAVGRQTIITPEADRISLVLRLPHQSGSLASTLALFADRGLNLSKIQSRPDPYQPWTYLFYFDVDCPANDERALSALYQLSREMPYLKLLGWYNEAVYSGPEDNRND